MWENRERDSGCFESCVTRDLQDTNVMQDMNVVEKTERDTGLNKPFGDLQLSYVYTCF